jgi:hypothetical protein
MATRTKTTAENTALSNGKERGRVDIIQTIQNLLSRATHPNTGEHEAGVCRAKD